MQDSEIYLQSINWILEKLDVNPIVRLYAEYFNKQNGDDSILMFALCFTVPALILFLFLRNNKGVRYIKSILVCTNFALLFTIIYTQVTLIKLEVPVDVISQLPLYEHMSSEQKEYFERAIGESVKLNHSHNYKYNLLYSQVERTIRYTVDKVFLND